MDEFLNLEWSVLEMNKADYFNDVNDMRSDFIDGSEERLKDILEYIERFFPDIKLVAVDVEKDEVIWGDDYLDSQLEGLE